MTEVKTKAESSNPPNCWCACEGGPDYFTAMIQAVYAGQSCGCSCTSDLYGFLWLAQGA